VTTTRAGFIGLGSQGGGMAERRIGQGLPTTLWARRPRSLEPFADRAAFAADPAELGHESDVVGICVTDGAAVFEVALGPRGVLAGMAAGGVLAIHATISPADCARVAEAAAPLGIDVIDAPVSGGGAAAAAGHLTVYAGGTGQAIAKARPVLETYGEHIFHLGPLGSGQRTKILNNALNAAHFALAHDALALGATLGLEPATLGDALRNGSGRSFSLEAYLAIGSFTAIAGHVGPIMAKDIGLFESETAGSSDRTALLDAADRFLELVGHRRALDEGGSS
jgi:3-hydroxyisobutyrate dehydrogenase-like beta-hydroxyacid dehydrogenase